MHDVVYIVARHFMDVSRSRRGSAPKCSFNSLGNIVRDAMKVAGLILSKQSAYPP